MSLKIYRKKTSYDHTLVSLVMVHYLTTYIFGNKNKLQEQVSWLEGIVDIPDVLCCNIYM